MPETDTPAKTRKTSSNKGKYLIVLGLAVYGGFVWYVGWQDIQARLMEADLLGIAVAAFMIFCATWMRVGKWRYALGADQHAIGLYFLSKATGDLTPGRLGEFAPLAMRNHRTAKVGAWILFDRIIEISVTLTLGLYGLAMIELLEPWQMGMFILCVIAGLIFGVYVVTHRGMFSWMTERVKPDGFLYKILNLCARISGEVWQFMKILPGVLGITVFTKVMDLFAIILVFKSLNVSVSFALIAASKCALAIAGSGPTPTVTGLPHGLQAWLMNYVDNIPYDALSAGIGIEIAIVSLTFWTSFGLAGRFIKRATAAKKTV